ncbi:hypothetical protein [Marininema halotolerans]|nr:hypothetical protein [Marininema halotolerans]
MVEKPMQPEGVTPVFLLRETCDAFGIIQIGVQEFFCQRGK